jgi:hypothetical protein
MASRFADDDVTESGDRRDAPRVRRVIAVAPARAAARNFRVLLLKRFGHVVDE